MREFGLFDDSRIFGVSPHVADLLWLSYSVVASNFYGEGVHPSMYHDPCWAAAGCSLAQTGYGIIAAWAIAVRMEQTVSCQMESLGVLEVCFCTLYSSLEQGMAWSCQAQQASLKQLSRVTFCLCFLHIQNPFLFCFHIFNSAYNWQTMRQINGKQCTQYRENSEETRCRVFTKIRTCLPPLWRLYRSQLGPCF